MKRIEICNIIRNMIYLKAGVEPETNTNNITFSSIGIKKAGISEIIAEVSRGFGIPMHAINPKQFLAIKNISEFINEMTDFIIDQSDIIIPAQKYDHEENSFQKNDDFSNSTNCSETDNNHHELILNNNVEDSKKELKKMGFRIIYDHKLYYYLWPEDIIKITCNNNISTIELLDGTTHNVTKCLKRFNYLLDFPFFIRSSKHDIFNIRHIKYINRKDDTIYLINGKTASMGTNYKSKCLDFFRSFWL
jgi:hypothetical protein